MDTILQMQKVTKVFPGVKALDGVDFSLQRGTVMALAGENGSGKSTLIKVLSGAYQPEAGSIVIDGETFCEMTPARSIAKGVSVIYQELNLVPQLTVYENIFLGKEPTKHGLIEKRRMIREAAEILDSLNISVSPTTKVRRLSVGFQQLVEVAKAIAQNAKILVLDEPTSALSNAEVQALFRILRTLKVKGVSMVYVSHRLEEVFEICDAVTVLRDGALVGRKDIADVDRESLIRMMVGRELCETYPERSVKPTGDICLRVEHLSGGPIRDMSFSLQKGEILGFAGLVGAGRTETMRVLFGADPQTGGTVTLDGETIHIREPKDAIGKGIGLIPEDRKQQGLILIASIRNNIAIANLDRVKTGPFLSERKQRLLSQKYIDYLRIRTSSDQKNVMELSGGNQQKVVLAKWLAKNCKVLILDEPTRGIDVGSKQEIYKLMRELTEKGISIIMISSEMPELIGMSDRIAVMHGYQIKKILNKDEFSQERILDYASGGKK